MIATAIRNHLWECSEGRRLSAGPCDFTISQLTSSLKWHWLTCLLLPLISTVHASALREVFIISLNSTGFIAKGCLSLYYSRERRLIFFPISTFYHLLCPKPRLQGYCGEQACTHMYILTRRRARVPLHTLTHTLFVAVPWKYYFCSSNIEILELWLFFFFLKMDGSHVF